MKDYIGKQVVWEKLEGKSDASMREKTGFGVVSVLDIDYRMVICGDYGISSSPVVSIEFSNDGLRVNTRNSTYLVKERS